MEGTENSKGSAADDFRYRRINRAEPSYSSNKYWKNVRAKSMDLELKFKEITGYEPTGDLVVTHEETMETAIPEYCPDLARIVDSVGQIRLREKSLSDGRLTMSGSIRVTVLYTSEENPGLRSLSLSVPFSCRVEDKRDCETISVESRLLLLEAKMLGARKLYVRALPEFRVGGYRKCARRLCTGVAEDVSLQLRRDQAVLPVLTDVWEREFNVAQEVPLDDGQDAELLMSRIFLRLTGCQHFGSKLVIKGEAVLSLLMRGEGQELTSRELTMPFSQIIDGEDLPEDATFSCIARILEDEVHPVRTENGGGLGVTLRANLEVRTYQQQTVEYVADLYSTRYNTVATRQVIAIPAQQPPEDIRRDNVQRLEGSGAFVYMTAADCTHPELTTGEGDRPVARSTVHMKVLYLDEAGTPVVTERSGEVNAEMRQMPSSVEADVEPEVWQRSANGYEVRVPVLFRMNCGTEEEITALTSAQQQEEIDRATMPSLVLRRLREGETLWDVAKQCKTEEQAILAANELESGTETTDMLLLIPKVR